MNQRILMFVFIVSSFYVHAKEVVASNPRSAIGGQHLVVAVLQFPVAIEVTRNSSGHIVSVSGVCHEEMSWLSQRYNFTYSYLQVQDDTVGPVNSSLPGMAYYLTRGVIMSALYPASSVFAKMDYTHGFMDGPNSFMIPMPNPSNGVGAIVKPFQLWVWVSLLGSFSAILAALLMLNCLIDIASTRLRSNEREQDPRTNSGQSLVNCEYATSKKLTTSGSVVNNVFHSLKDVWCFALGVLLNQGGYCSSSNLAVRLAAGAWCLAAFVMINSYNSLLTSYLTSPSAQPLVEELEDLGQDPRYWVVVDKGSTVDIVLSSATVGIYKALGDKLRGFPKSRCSVREECTQIVKTGGSHVYISNLYAVMGAMYDDYRATGKCNLAMARRNRATSRSLHWGLPKFGYLTENFNRGLLVMSEHGLTNFWVHHHQPNIRRCVDEWSILVERKRKDGTRVPPLSITNMRGAFVVLTFGFAASLMIFMGEIIHHVFKIRCSTFGEKPLR